MKPDQPIRVLHVNANMNLAGGVQSWLVGLFRHLDPTRVSCDVMVETNQSGGHEQTLQRLGVRLIRGPSARRPWSYGRQFQRHLAEYGPYDIVHCHEFTWCGMVMRVAARAGIQGRIAHSHTVESPMARQHPWLWRCYAAWMKRWIRRYSSVGLACSDQAAAGLYGDDWHSDPRWIILPNGIDVSAYAESAAAPAVRQELGIPDSALVIGAIGRLAPVKNLAFLIDTARQLFELDPQARLLLIGEGALRADLEQQAKRLAIADRVIFAGNRSDVPRLLLGAIDLVVVPSHYEGFGLVALEAQAAGVPVLTAEHLPHEVEVIGPLVHWKPLSDGPHHWADAIMRIAAQPRPISPADALEQIQTSTFSMQTCVDRLTEIYQGVLGDV